MNYKYFYYFSIILICCLVFWMIYFGINTLLNKEILELWLQKPITEMSIRDLLRVFLFGVGIHACLTIGTRR